VLDVCLSGACGEGRNDVTVADAFRVAFAGSFGGALTANCTAN